MATRKAITLVSGLFQEVNTPTDKLDFAGNTTADLGENTNLYFTNARARGAVSVTDSGGFGSLAYNNSTGVITYTGTSTSDIRGSVSGNSVQGLTYDQASGAFGLANIPNSSIANSSLTIGNTAVGLGATVGTFAGLTSLASTTLIAGTEDAANAIEIGSGNIIFEGSTADANEIILTAADATGGDKTLTLPNETGTILTSASSIPNSGLANASLTIGATGIALGTTASTISGLTSLTSTNLVAGSGANSILLGSGNITFEGSTANDFETSLTVTDPTADRTITFPDATGTVALLTSLSIASGSGLTYNSSTGEFSTNAIPNSKLANSSVTVGSTGIALGGSATTITGLSSITSSAVVTDDNGFRIRDNSDNTKQLAFECSGISGSTTRTLTVPDASDTLVLLGATQTLTNKSLTSATLTGSTSIGTGTTFSADGTLTTSSSVIVENSQPGISFVDTGANPDFIIQNRDGSFAVRDTTNAANRFLVDMANGNITATGNISVTGTVDGVDIATRDTLFGGLTASSGVLSNGVQATTQSASDNSTKVATTAYVDNQVTAGTTNEFADNVFRVKDNSDASKKLAFECSGISGSTTRTMTVPNTDGTISTESFATAIAVALG